MNKRFDDELETLLALRLNSPYNPPVTERYEAFLAYFKECYGNAKPELPSRHADYSTPLFKERITRHPPTGSLLITVNGTDVAALTVEGEATTDMILTEYYNQKRLPIQQIYDGSVALRTTYEILPFGWKILLDRARKSFHTHDFTNPKYEKWYQELHDVFGWDENRAFQHMKRLEDNCVGVKKAA